MTTMTLNTKMTAMRTMRWTMAITMLRISTTSQRVSLGCYCIDFCANASSLPAEKEDDPEKALKAFRKIVDSETEKGEW